MCITFIHRELQHHRASLYLRTCTTVRCLWHSPQDVKEKSAGSPWSISHRLLRVLTFYIRGPPTSASLIIQCLSKGKCLDVLNAAAITPRPKIATASHPDNLGPLS
ncbi:hypothetical protein RvY_02856 [Ramazzottius varieornatus]|uniref:Uncharacterized protein n=1 Tax=Ramazzottius varieornatus TaxID=947166 RepID=A0A1D1URV9_RAMVA|nr:hypothetical protein RvY_02856 [Ramazzottius varieornatus]